MKLKAFVNLLTAGSTVGFPLSCIGVLYWKTDFFKQENAGVGKNKDIDEFIKKEQEQKAKEEAQQTTTAVNPTDDSQTKADVAKSPASEAPTQPKNSSPQQKEILPAAPKAESKAENVSPQIQISLPNVSQSSSGDVPAKAPDTGNISSMTPENLSKWIQVVINKVIKKRQTLEKENPQNKTEIDKCKSTISSLKQLKKLVEDIKVSDATKQKAVAAISANT